MPDIEELRNALLARVVGKVAMTRQRGDQERTYFEVDPEFESEMIERYKDVRILAPDYAMTMDYKPHRVNISLIDTGECYVVNRVYLG